MTVSCPACGAESFRLEREEDPQRYDGAGFAVFCSDCGNATAQVVARTLDARLQADDDQVSLSGWSE